MQQAKIVKSSLGKEIKFLLIGGILAGAAVCVLEYFVYLFFGDSMTIRRLHSWLQWPYGMLPATAFILLIVLFRRTTVAVYADEVVISRIGWKRKFPIRYFHGPVVSKKTHIISIVKKTNTMLYLCADVPSGTKAYRLFDFTEQGLEQAVQYIRERHTANMPIEEKLDVQNSLEDLEEIQCEDGGTKPNVFPVSAEEICRSERKSILKIGGVWLVLGVFMMIFLVDGFGENGVLSFQVLFFLILLLLLITSVPFQLFRLSRRMRRCPEYIKVEQNAIWLGRTYFSFTSLSGIRMVSPDKKSGSIFPVQYEMTIQGAGEKQKYYLGSQASYGEYRRLCETLEKALIMYPEKLTYRR